MSPSAVHAGSNFVALMLGSALRSLLLGCFLAAVLAVFRVRAVRARLFAWQCVLLIAIVMPALMLLSPAVPLPIPVPSVSRTAAASVLTLPPAPVPAHRSVDTRSPNDERFAPASESAASLAELNLPQSPLPGFSLPGRALTISWLSAALLLYFTVALIFFARVLIGAYFARRLRLRAQAIDDAAAIDLFWAASRTNRLRRIPQFSESELLAVPVTLGIFRPAVLLPCSWRNWANDELAAVLAHEVSHVARRDSLVQSLALVHRAVFWFSPLSWWLDRHLAALAEQASDEAALSGGMDRTRYAQALVDFLANLEASPARVWWHGVAMATSGEGEKRVERILAWRSSMNAVSTSVVVALIAICIPAVALSVAARPAAYHAQEIAVPPAPAPPPPPQQLAPPENVPVPPPAPVAVPVLPSDAPPAQAAQHFAPPVPPQAPAAASSAPQSPQSPDIASAPPAPPAQAAPPLPVPPEPPDVNMRFHFQLQPMTDTYWTWAPRFVIVTRGSDHLIVSGSEDDAEHARSLRSKISGDFIWFEHDGRSYIIRDQAIVNRAKQLWAQRGDSAKQQELQAKEQELSKEMREQVQQRMQEVRVKIPDMSTELLKLQSEIKSLNASGATMQQLGDLQRQVGELQQALGEARWNSNMDEINRRAGELGRQMGEIGRQLGELARQSVEQARQSSRQMRQLFDDAIASGQAKPE